MTDNANIILGDVLEWAATYDGEPFHALLADPPYHLTSIVNRFSEGEPEHTKTAQDIKYRRTPHARQAAGFMGKKWDGGDIAFQPETWAALGKHLHPGAFVMAFAGTRGYHRMACAIEDAGFLIHPAIGWLFGSGFPKSTRIKGDPAFDAHRYGLQAMKPAFEFVCVAQKPYKGKPQDCIKRTGAGSLNIGAGRIGKESTITRNTAGVDKFAHKFSGARVPRCGDYENPEGRWPANLALDETGAGIVDRQSGVSVSNGKPRIEVSGDSVKSKTGGFGIQGGRPLGFQTPGGLKDSGGASRFYLTSDWHAEVLEQLDECDRAFYVAKAGRAERDAGLERFFGTERADTGALRDGERTTEPRFNTHPTIKPLRLNKWLASLLLPPDAYTPRRLLNPFCGSGSEACGALLAGWDEIIGIEREAEYHGIAEARVKFWSGNVGLFEALTAGTDEEPPHPTLDLAG